MAFAPRNHVVQMRAVVPWLMFRNPKSERWMAVCPSLNLNAIGDTRGELQECANEAMQLLFEDLFITGELEAFLRKNGWQPVDQLPPPGSAPPKFDVPTSWQEKNRVEDLVTA